jgi:hypothetical protein
MGQPHNEGLMGRHVLVEWRREKAGSIILVMIVSG